MSEKKNIFAEAAEKQKKQYINAEIDQKASTDKKINVGIRITEEQDRQARIRAAQKGLKLSAYVATLIENDL
jgi:predicted HicB family RNase H-like nuclease